MAVKVVTPYAVLTPDGAAYLTGVNKRVVMAKVNGNTVDRIKSGDLTIIVTETISNLSLSTSRIDVHNVTVNPSFEAPPEPFLSLLSTDAENYAVYVDGTYVTDIDESGSFETTNDSIGKMLSIRPKYRIGDGPASAKVEVPPDPADVPIFVTEIPDQYIAPRQRRYIDLSLYMVDATGDTLTFTESESFPGVASIGTYEPDRDRWTNDADGHWLRLRGHASQTGTGPVTVTARDPSNNSITDTFQVIVTTDDPVITDTIPDVELFVSGTQVTNRRIFNLNDYFTDLEQMELSYAIADTVFVDVTLENGMLTIIARRTLTSGTMTVTATDAEGGSVSQTFDIDVIRNPGAPLEPGGNSPAFDPVNSTDVTIHWSHATSGPARTGYRVRYKTTDESDWIVLAALPANATSLRIVGLVPETTYQFDIFAFNDAGESPGLRYVTTTTLTDTIPDVQLFVSGTGDRNSITLDMTNYFIDGQSYTFVDDVFVDVEIDGDNFTIFSRRVLTSGEMTITATDSGGTETSQTFDVDVVRNPGAPLEPSSISATAETDNIAITWIHATGGATRTGYRVRWRVAGSQNWTLLDDLSADTTGIDITDLTESTSYTIDIFAFNDAGESPGVRTVNTTLASPTDVEPRPAASVAISITNGGIVTVTPTWEPDNPDGVRDGWDVGLSTNTRFPPVFIASDTNVPISQASYTLPDALTVNAFYYGWARGLSGSLASEWIRSEGEEFENAPLSPAEITFTQISGNAGNTQNENTSQTFSALVFGRFDTISYSWVVSDGTLGTLTNANTSTPVYTVGEVGENRSQQIILTATARGTGINAIAGSVAVAQDDLSFTIVNVPSALDPAGASSVSLAISTDSDGNSVITITPTWLADNPSSPRTGWNLRFGTDPTTGVGTALTGSAGISETSITHTFAGALLDGTYFARVQARSGTRLSGWTQSADVVVDN